MDNRICGHNRCFTKYRHSIELIINMFDALSLYCLSDSSCLILCINIFATILKVRLASYFWFCLDYSINCRNQLHKSKRIFYKKKHSSFFGQDSLVIFSANKYYKNSDKGYTKIHKSSALPFAVENKMEPCSQRTHM